MPESRLFLSPHFTLAEMCFSQEAARRGWDNTPNVFQIANLTRLCTTALEPIRQEVKSPTIITSGYRCPRVNTAVGGSQDSEHMDGRAADTHVQGMSIVDLFELVRRLDLPINQCILEYDQWVHVSVPKIGQTPLKEYWHFQRVNGKTVKTRLA